MVKLLHLWNSRPRLSIFHSRRRPSCIMVIFLLRQRRRRRHRHRSCIIFSNGSSNNRSSISSSNKNISNKNISNNNISSNNSSSLSKLCNCGLPSAPLQPSINDVPQLHFQNYTPRLRACVLASAQIRPATGLPRTRVTEATASSNPSRSSRFDTGDQPNRSNHRSSTTGITRGNFHTKRKCHSRSHSGTIIATRAFPIASHRT